MLIKTLILTALIAITLYSEETNASVLSANTCTLGLLPLPITQSSEQIIQAFEQKGFYVTILKSPSEIADVEFISDAQIECIQTYFGTMAKTSVRIIDTASRKIITHSSTPGMTDLLNNCNLELLKAINLLPNCQTK
jgi:hypothetical protein